MKFKRQLKLNISQNSALGNITLERMPISKLLPADYNPRKITLKAKKGLSKSITKFGLVQPIVWNKHTGNIVGGHKRLDILISEGVTHTDVNIVDLSIIQEKALNIALNSAAITGTFTSRLNPILEEIKKYDSELFKGLNLRDTQLPDIDKVELPTREPKTLIKLYFDLTLDQKLTVNSAFEHVLDNNNVTNKDNPNKNGNALHFLAKQYMDNKGISSSKFDTLL